MCCLIALPWKALSAAAISGPSSDGAAGAGGEDGDGAPPHALTSAAIAIAADIRRPTWLRICSSCVRMAGKDIKGQVQSTLRPHRAISRCSADGDGSSASICA